MITNAKSVNFVKIMNLGTNHIVAITVDFKMDRINQC